MSGRRRGQTLVMMTLMALLLTLMVMMTISIGTKAKEKMEVQTMSDSAAYSQAIVTARSFNSVSTMNRVGIAYVVATTAIQSLVSWSTYVYANQTVLATHIKNWNTMFKIIYNMPTILGGCCPFGGQWSMAGCTPGIQCLCAFDGRIETAAQHAIVVAENDIFQVELRALDAQAWVEALAMLISADWVHLLGQLPVYGFLTSFTLGQSGVKNLVNQSGPGDQYGMLKVNGDPDGVNFGEVMPLGGAMYPLNPIYWHHAFAANGSRLHPFLVNRKAASTFINLKLMTLIDDLGISFQQGQGSGYVTGHPGDQHGGNMLTTIPFPLTYFSADDHSKAPGLVSVYLLDGGMCWALLNRAQATKTYARLESNQAFGIHEANNFFCPLLHNIGGLGRGYPWFMDYNFFLLDNDKNIYGQPKNFGVVYRDLSKAPAGGADQWNPLFRFGFSRTGTSGYDNRGLTTKNGQDISRQVGFSTGVTYYHRGNNNAAEPPNYFNPFWRGGLTRANIDDPLMTGGDVGSTLGGYPAAMDAYNGLKAAGFKGWQ